MQNVMRSFYSRLFDFEQGWLYVPAIGPFGGTMLHEGDGGTRRATERCPALGHIGNSSAAVTGAATGISNRPIGDLFGAPAGDARLSGCAARVVQMCAAISGPRLA